MVSKRQLAAIMFTDIAGYTALMQQDERTAIRTREKHRSIFNQGTKKYNGRILQYYGDGTLSIFDSAIEAVKCAIEMQLDFQAEPAVPVRIGIHTGDIVFSDEEIIGDGVNVASRIESLAVPGSVFISDKVYDEIKNHGTIRTSLINKFKLKNVERRYEVYAISNPGLVVPDKESIKGKAIPEDDKSSVQPALDPAAATTSPQTDILATKLYFPKLRPQFVHRNRLTEFITQGLNGKLTLIAAPAGFGKTTLVTEWISQNTYPVTWLSLDDADNDVNRFIKYIIASLQKISEQTGASALELLQSPTSPPVETILTSLLNDISTITEEFIFVLDDYHVINTSPVDEALMYLLDHMPPQMHLIMTTREDPNIQLPRLRVRGQVTELRAAELRFTPSEAAGFLNQVMNLTLSEADVATLEARTEGWIAGLQLAALSLQGRENISDFISTFAGHDRYVVDYLVEEVLQNLPDDTRNFLLSTSVLERFCTSLCDAITEREDSKRILEELDRANLFLIPLDNNRNWYRYHHLFAEVLHAHARDEMSVTLSAIHLRASEWFDRNGFPDDAIQHALAGDHFEKAAALIELVWPAMDESFRSTTWLNWIKLIPGEMEEKRPVLLVGHGWALLNIGVMEEGMKFINKAEKLLSNSENLDPEDLIIVDETQFRSLPAVIYGAYAYNAMSSGDPQGAVDFAKKSLALLPKDDHVQRATGNAFLGLAYLSNGDLEEAYQNFDGFITKVLKTLQS